MISVLVDLKDSDQKEENCGGVMDDVFDFSPVS